MVKKGFLFGGIVMEKVKIYEGKAKILYDAGKDNIIAYYKDDITAFDGQKRCQIKGKGVINNLISSYLFKLLEDKGIKTHFIKRLNDREQLLKKVKIIPLEVIVRNVASGSFSKRLGIEEGTKLDFPVFEICYKNDALGDPLINDYHAIVLKIASFEELKEIYSISKKVNKILKDFFDEIGIELVDFKLEFGRFNDEILLADEISPDTCRLWDKKTGEKFDKDRFRKELGDVLEGYSKILKRLNGEDKDEGIN